MGWLSKIKKTATLRRKIRRLKPPSKRISQMRHAKRRAFERYGIVLNMNEAVKQIQSGKGDFLERRSNRITVWLVQQQNKEIRVVYDKLRHVIVTCLPWPDKESRNPQKCA